METIGIYVKYDLSNKGGPLHKCLRTADVKLGFERGSFKFSTISLESTER